ncbi:Eco57I restriction-modification methylase domain-containing protein [Botrimarina hoheduenensis]|nr:DNA methyltransferase [Botrimarina hoheduenensis]
MPSAQELEPLDKQLRSKLEKAVEAARDVAEEAAAAACMQLGIGRAKPDAHLSEEQRDLRRRLRIHGRQLGDERDPKTEVQEVVRLVEEIAYEHWHRMLFARFLAENQLLMYPDPDEPVAVSLEDCEDLAADEGAANGWELAARFATKMLPQIFRIESPAFALDLPPEKQQRLEQLLSELPPEVFTASDSLGWVYQFWQTKRKKAINESEVKIGARELPAVTQLFTEPYMVSFLLDNSLGAWWAARRLSEDDLQNAESEQELRDKASLPDVPFEYLRFVRTSSGDEGEGEENTGPWTPAAGTFDAWPESLSELKTLDPCCGSGHFLVAALLMLTPMRMELEELSATEAVDRVLSENLHGLEIDQRCVELAAFALALAAWRFPNASGYRVLPDLNVACCGLSVSVAKDEWKKLAGGDNQLRIALDWMYDEFKDAPLLGSLFNPKKSGLPLGVNWQEFAGVLEEVLAAEPNSQIHESAVVAHGMAKAIVLLSKRFGFVITNVPYLARAKQSPQLQDFSSSNYDLAKGDLATTAMRRCLEFTEDDGATALVLPQNWLFLRTYACFRERVLEEETWNLLARLGPGAFREIGGEVVKAILLVTSHRVFREGQLLSEARPSSTICNFDVADQTSVDDKAIALIESNAVLTQQIDQLENEDSIVQLSPKSGLPLLSQSAYCYQGTSTGDNPRFAFEFWELESTSSRWRLLETVPRSTQCYAGKENVVDWENVVAFDGAAIRGEDAHKGRGVIIGQMSSLPASIYTGEKFANSTPVIIVRSDGLLLPVWLYVSSSDFTIELRKVNQKLSVDNGYVGKIPFDLAHWQQVASEKYPHGLPEPYSDDPTQWLFHGHPASSTDALQVAVARLLGYRWPAELDAEMELATDARAWVERSSQLTDSSQNDTADDDGIVCIPAVGTEQPAEDRLLNLLHRAYEDARAQEQVFRDKLDAADSNDGVTVDLWRRGWQPSLPDSFPAWRDSLLEGADHTGKTLESWLRDKFFAQHFKLFHHRPFIWQIWDGLKDGFSVLVNYHKLDNKLLETLIYTYLNDWIKTQKNQVGNVDGSQERLDAANALKAKLELILQGESPHDIFVRWKPLEQQPIGWNPDINDGVRLNIRPWLTVGDVGKRGAGVLRDKPNCKWTKDRGKDVESAPWYHLGLEYDGKEGDRINDHHLTLEEKKAARLESTVEVGA